MNGFLSLFDSLLDFLKPAVNENPDSNYTRCCARTCQPCLSLFDLVRADSMAYVNLTGNPYCNSARYCEYLCRKSLIMDYSQSTSRIYRICAHFLIAGIVLILALYIKGSISLGALLVILAEALTVSTFFINIHADSSEAIQIVFLQEEDFTKRDSNH